MSQVLWIWPPNFHLILNLNIVVSRILLWHVLSLIVFRKKLFYSEQHLCRPIRLLLSVKNKYQLSKLLISEEKDILHILHYYTNYKFAKLKRLSIMQLCSKKVKSCKNDCIGNPESVLQFLTIVASCLLWTVLLTGWVLKATY